MRLRLRTGEMTIFGTVPDQPAISTVAPAISTVAPVISTVASAISNSDTGIYDRDSGFAELSATLDITSAFQLPEAIAGSFRP